MLLTPIAPGATCAAGGTRIDVGVDTDGNGQLDPAEVQQTAVVCNAGENGGGSGGSGGIAGAGGSQNTGGAPETGGTGGTPNGACLTGADCATGAVCEGGALETRCGHPECHSNADCAGEYCNRQHVCTPYLPPGSSCSRSITADRVCWRGYACGSNSLCVLATPGASCSLDTDCSVDEKCVYNPTGGLKCADPHGALCTMGASCAEDEYCPAVGFEFDRCTPRGSVGASCAEDFQCLSELYCGPQDAPVRTCIPRKDVGEACTFTGLPGNWPAGDPCRKGAFCDSATDKCVAFPSEGELCERSNYCGPGLACMPVHVGGQCRLPETCTTESQCTDGKHCTGATSAPACVTTHCTTDGDCSSGRYCSTGQCLPYRRVGESCAGGEPCAPDLVCNASAGICAEHAHRGEDCNQYRLCDSGSLCLKTQSWLQTQCYAADDLVPCDDGTTSCPASQFCGQSLDSGIYQCMPRIPGGATCSASDGDFDGIGCESDHVCTFLEKDGVLQQTCTPNNAVGTQCSGIERDCLPSDYCARSIFGFSCVPRIAVGEPCGEPVGDYNNWGCVASAYCDPVTLRCAPQDLAPGQACPPFPPGDFRDGDPTRDGCRGDSLCKDGVCSLTEASACSPACMPGFDCTVTFTNGVCE